MRFVQIVATSHVDRRVSRESITRGCSVSCGATGVERDHHQRVQHYIWLDRCRARASRVGAAYHLDQQVSSESTTSGCRIAFGPAGVKREPHQWEQHLIWIDRCRTKCKPAPTGDVIARHLLIKMECCTLW